MPLHVTDSPDAFATAVQIAPTVTAYPFASAPVPDTAARTHTRLYRQAIAAHAPATATRTSHTNLLLRSSAIATSPWGGIETSFANDIVANPWDGTVTAGRMLETAATAEHQLFQNYTFTAGAYTATIIVKGLGRQKCRLMLYDGTNFHAATLNFDTGETVATLLSPTPTAISLGGGWWQFSITTTLGSGAGGVYVNTALADGTVSFTGDTAKGLYVAHAQLETGSTPGPLIITTTATRTVSAPATDATDPFAYLVDESDLNPSPLGRTLTFARTYARIPADQVTPTTTLFARPNLHDLKSGSTYAVSFDDGLTSSLFSSRQSISSVGAITSQTVTTSNSRSATFPSATVTITRTSFAAVTFNLTDSAASIRSAIEAIYGGSTVSALVKTPSSLRIVPVSAFADIKDISVSAAGVTATYSSGIFDFQTSYNDTESGSDSVAPPPAVRSISVTGHGGSAGERVALWNGDALVATAVVYSATTDAIVVPAIDGALSGGSLTLTHMQFEDNAAYRIVNGPIRVSAKRTTKFYLPGVSTGITTAADIVPPTVVTDPQGWLGQAVAYLASPTNNTFAVHEVADLTSWRGPILAQEILSLQLADAIRSV